MAGRSETTGPRPLGQSVRLQRAFLSHFSALTPQPAPAPNATQLRPFLKPLGHLFTHFPWPGKPFPSCPPWKGCFILKTAHMLLLSVAATPCPPHPPSMQAEQPLCVLSSEHCHKPTALPGRVRIRCHCTSSTRHGQPGTTQI